MGLRFRKTISLIPGVRVNLSKSGPSLSLGEKGFSYNIGSKGQKATVGLPGTGLSYSQQTRKGKNVKSVALVLLAGVAMAAVKYLLKN